MARVLVQVPDPRRHLVHCPRDAPPRRGRPRGGGPRRLGVGPAGADRGFPAPGPRLNAAAWLDTLRDDDHDHPLPRRRPSWVAVCRRDYTVYRVPLTRPGYRLLEALAAGRTVGEAVELCLQRSRPRPTGDQVFTSFREWARAGAFQGVAL